MAQFCEFAKKCNCIFWVKLLVKGLEALNAISKAGVDIVACGTCVSFYKLNGKLTVGRISDMQEIVGILTSANSVITI